MLHTFEAHDHWDIVSRWLGEDAVVIDELSAPLLSLAALLYFLTCLATLRTKVRRFPFAWTLVSLALVLAMLSCREPWGVIALLAAQVGPPLLELRTRGKSTRVFLLHMLLFLGLLIAGWAMIEAEGPQATHSMWAIGMFLLLCVALIPTVLHRIPLAALAAMLIYTGFRLTHPKEFLHVYKIGREQLVVFVSTLIGVLATDLLIGILIGIGVKLVIHLINGVPVWSLFKPYIDVEPIGEDQAIVRARYSAVFSNWILFRRQLVRLGFGERRSVTVDLSQTRLVDHSVMEKLHALQSDFESAGLRLEIRGLEGHRLLAEHDLSARKRELTRLRRVTVVVDEDLEDAVTAKFVELGASGYTATACHGVGRRALADGHGERTSQVRLEVVVPPELSNHILDYLHADIGPHHRVTACTETVEVLRRDVLVDKEQRHKKRRGKPPQQAAVKAGVQSETLGNRQHNLAVIDRRFGQNSRDWQPKRTESTFAGGDSSAVAQGNFVRKTLDLHVDYGKNSRPKNAVFNR